ncbi:AraC family transcriptional regulator [Microbaculum marinum]|uniref:AraC family transcriptional regulator ligand-binding domain-containing protein n=1 Tax=Microbaculum marinum TaxID=1764581 RepID=A0AAW9RLY4_9HYPH
MRGIEIERLRIAAAMLRGVEDFTSAAGIEFQSLANAVGLGPIDPDDENQFVNLDCFAKFLEISSILAGDDSHGLRMAVFQKQVLSGPLSLAQLNAPTMREALVTMIKYIGTRVDLANMELVVEGDTAAIEWAFSPLFVRRWQLLDFTAGTLVGRMSRILAQDWRPTTMGLTRPAPKNRDVHRQHLGRSLEYACGTNYIAFNASLLAVPIQNADPVVYDISTRLLNRMLEDRNVSADFVTAIREEIIHGLSSEEGALLDRIARRMGMSVRSLQRGLAEHGMTYQTLVDSTRKSLAVRYLEDPGLTFSQIAYQLGFSAPSAFTRASYRWFGQRPGAVRKSLRRGIQIQN